MGKCPFCGSTDNSAVHRKVTRDGEGKYLFYVKCKKCGAQGPEVILKVTKDKDVSELSMHACEIKSYDRWELGR